MKAPWTEPRSEADRLAAAAVPMVEVDRYYQEACRVASTTSHYLLYDAVNKRYWSPWKWDDPRAAEANMGRDPNLPPPENETAARQAVPTYGIEVPTHYALRAAQSHMPAPFTAVAPTVTGTASWVDTTPYNAPHGIGAPPPTGSGTGTPISFPGNPIGAPPHDTGVPVQSTPAGPPQSMPAGPSLQTPQQPTQHTPIATSPAGYFPNIGRAHV